MGAYGAFVKGLRWGRLKVDLVCKLLTSLHLKYITQSLGPSLHEKHEKGPRRGPLNCHRNIRIYGQVPVTSIVVLPHWLDAAALRSL